MFRFGVSLALLGKSGVVVGSPLVTVQGQERVGAVDLFVVQGGGCG